ncbi:UNVERIFIED_CONTAM: S8 family serine peptidase, partial [Pseudomonas aeruginosa]
SLGPVTTFFDDDVHEWTSRLDTELSDGQTLCTVAVGNNGLLGEELGRIQPPGDAVNAFAIGAAGSTKKKWGRAPYSALGPGRSPGYVKPDVLAFGGSDEEPVPVFSPLANTVIPVAGTSFASPLALRVAVGADVLS